MYVDPLFVSSSVFALETACLLLFCFLFCLFFFACLFFLLVCLFVCLFFFCLFVCLFAFLFVFVVVVVAVVVVVVVFGRWSLVVGGLVMLEVLAGQSSGGVRARNYWLLSPGDGVGYFGVLSKSCGLLRSQLTARNTANYGGDL